MWQDSFALPCRAHVQGARGLEHAAGVHRKLKPAAAASSSGGFAGQVRRHCCAVRCHDELDQIGQIIVRKLWRRHHHRRLERHQLAHLPHSQRRHQTDNYRIIRSHHRCCHVLFLQGSGCNKKVRRLDVVKSRQYDKLGRVTAAKLET